jgi:hypothetical protein
MLLSSHLLWVMLISVPATIIRGSIMLSTSSSTQALNSRRSRSFLGGLFDRDIGDSTRSAKEVTLRSGRSYSHSGDVGGKDLDFFRVKFDRSTQFTARLKNEDKDDPIALTILDSDGDAVQGNNGKFLFRNIESGRTKQLSTRLSAGTYFVRLESANGRNQDYDLDLSVSSSSGSSDDNGSNLNLDRARNLGRLESGRTYRESGSVGGSDVDIFRFNTRGTSRILADLNNDGNDDVAFRLLDSSGQTVRIANGNFLFANVRADDTETLLAPTLGAGTYYFAIQSSAGRNEDYDFRLRQSSDSVTPI